jgi:hypothetical protein
MIHSFVLFFISVLGLSCSLNQVRSHKKTQLTVSPSVISQMNQLSQTSQSNSHDNKMISRSIASDQEELLTQELQRPKSVYFQKLFHFNSELRNLVQQLNQQSRNENLNSQDLKVCPSFHQEMLMIEKSNEEFSLKKWTNFLNDHHISLLQGEEIFPWRFLMLNQKIALDLESIESFQESFILYLNELKIKTDQELAELCEWGYSSEYYVYENYLKLEPRDYLEGENSDYGLQLWLEGILKTPTLLSSFFDHFLFNQVKVKKTNSYHEMKSHKIFLSHPQFSVYRKYQHAIELTNESFKLRANTPQFITPLPASEISNNPIMELQNKTSMFRRSEI